MYKKINSMYCLETENLSYSFSKNEAILKNLNLQVNQGSIYGFLGPNGAGKTTTLRLVLGLLKMQSGSIRVFGDPLESNRKNILRRTGSLIESPSLYSQLTAMENLLVWQKIYQCPKERMQEVLNKVGLGATKTKKAGQFSLGMKQRLTIAIALLNNPGLLILDEPTNGLDPNGILEIRELLKQLNQENGITIIISSHLLTEIEKLVSHVGLIHGGNMLFQGTLTELMNKQKMSSSTVIDTNNNVEAARLIKDQTRIDTLTDQAGKLLLPALSKTEAAAVNQQLVQGGFEVYELSIAKTDLESVFMDLIK